MDQVLNLWSLLFHIANLVVLYFAVKHFAYKPVSKFLAERTQRIEQEREAAALAQQQADRLLEECNQRQSKVSAEADELMAKALTDAKARAAQLIEQAQNEIREMREAEKARLSAERERSSEQLREDTVNAALELSERILMREVNARDNEEIINKFLEKVG